MKKFVKLISLVLVLLMLVASFASCNKDKGNEEDKKDEQTQAKTESGDTDVVTTKVPDIEVKNWDGKEYRVLGKDSTGYQWAVHFEVWRQEVPEDVVGKAVWDRNQDMLQNYGVDVVGYLDSSCNSLAKTSLESGEDLYDLILISPEAFHPHAIKGYLLDIRSLDYINLEHDAWMDYPNEQLTMGGKLFYTTNRFLIQDKNRYWGMFYNRDMANELNLGYFEDFVFDGTWTLDKLVELAKAATADIDGNPGLGKGDRWGVGASENYHFCTFAYGAGFRLTQNDASGYPALVGAPDNILSRLDKVYALTGDRSIYYNDQVYGSIDWKDCADQMFHRGEVLVSATVLSELQTVGAKINFKMGVLPAPKYDESQEAYHTIPNLGNGSLLGVPATVMEPEFAGYGLELISEKSVDTSYKAFIETNCKLQKVQDGDAAKCLELIYDGIVYDIGFVCDLGGLGSMVWKTLAATDANNYSRTFTRSKKVAETKIEETRKAYAELAKN